MLCSSLFGRLRQTAAALSPIASAAPVFVEVLMRLTLHCPRAEALHELFLED